MEVMDTTTYAGISVAQRVAMRFLTKSEYKRVKEGDGDLHERAAKAMSRLQFIDQLRYAMPQNLVPVDSRDALQGFDRDGLEVYLLCTCLDTVAGKGDYIDLPSWLKTKEARYCGILARNKALSALCEGDAPFNQSRYLGLMSTLLEEYHKHYGVTRSIKDMVQALPEYIKSKFVASYVIYKRGQNDQNWHGKDIQQKANAILDYLLECRRNVYTHSAEALPTIGGIRSFRVRLIEGQIDLPASETVTIDYRRSKYVVTCNPGYEALLLRWLVFACLAKSYNLISKAWVYRYNEFQRQYRVLQALLYELEHNAGVGQYYMSALCEGLRVPSEHAPRFKTLIYRSLLQGGKAFRLSFMPILMPQYLEALDSFNEKLNSISKKSCDTLDPTKPLERLRALHIFANNLMWDYPRWIYDKKYVYDFSGP